MAFDIVTGGAGFIGSHLVDRLIADGRKVKVIDSFIVGHPRNLQQHKGNPDFTLVEGDICDAAMLEKEFTGVDHVYHLAARADIVPSIQEPRQYYRSNVEGTFNVLEAARKSGAKRLVYVASSSSYGIPDHYPTPENTPISPQHPYALTKHLGEEMVLHWAKVYQLPALSVRFFNIYGPRARTSGTYGAVFGVFLAQMLGSKPLTIVGDGTQTRDFTFVSDAVDALVTAARSDKTGEAYNVGSSRPVSVNELVSLLDYKDTVNIPKRPGEPDCTFADTTKIERDLGWHAKVPFEEGVKIMLQNIDYWRDAPVWTVDAIAGATADWFKYLGNNKAA